MKGKNVKLKKLLKFLKNPNHNLNTRVIKFNYYKTFFLFSKNSYDK